MDNLQLNILRVGLLLDYYSLDNIFDWAQAELSRVSISSKLSEILLSTSTKAEMVSALRDDNPTDTILINSHQFFLSFYYHCLKELRNDWFSIEAEMLRYFSIVDPTLLEGGQKLFISMLNNDFSLREEKLPSPMDMPNDLISFLEPYKDYNNLLVKYHLPPLVMSNSSPTK